MPCKSQLKTLLTLALISGCLLFYATAALAAVSATYTYDELDRLTRIDYSDGAFVTYVYDKIGNRLSTTCSGTGCLFTISAKAGSGGSISPAAASVTAGGSQGFFIIPNTGYHIASMAVDGKAVTAATTYNFTNVTAPHYISATFALNTP